MPNKRKPRPSKDPRMLALAIVRAWGREGGKARWKGVSAADRRAHARYAISVRWAKAKAKKSQ